MFVNVRSATLSLGRWLLPALIVPSALACSAPGNPTDDPERAFVETPGGRRVAFTAPKQGEVASPLSLAGHDFVIAKFEGRISPAARNALKQAGYREVGYLPYDALLLERPANATDRVIPGMMGFAPYVPQDRISRELLAQELAARPAQPLVPMMVHVMPGRDRAAVRAAIEARGGKVLGDGTAGAFGRLSVLFPGDMIAGEAQLLAERSDIFFLERIHRIGLYNDKLVGTMQSGVQGNAAEQTPIWQHGIRGEGQIVGEIDTGLDANSCYFGDTELPATNTWSMAGGYGTATSPSHRKIVAYDFLYSCDQWPSGTNCETPTNLAQWDTQGHGTHVAGNMVADSDNNPENFALQDAIAPAAKIVIQDGAYLSAAQGDTCAELPGIGCPLINLEPVFEQSFQQGARLHNNSYGDNEEAMPPYLQANYTARTVDVDKFMWEHKEFLIVYAAGNYGRNNTEFSVGSPSTMKNGLGVGSTRVNTASNPSDENISGFSSRGWSADGRIKPDIMTPGHNAAATNQGGVGGTPNCGASAGGGTSYAAPVAVGAAALVRQYFTDGFYPAGAKNDANKMTPTAALIKAVLINSGVPMTGNDNAGQPITPIPSNEQGWGRVRLDQTLVFADGTRKIFVDDHRETIAAGATTPFTYSIKGATAGQPIKITLTWTDYPGMPDSPPSAQPSLTDAETWNAARLVNDLDLTVTGPSGVTYLGNVWENGESKAGGTADRRNNVEQVLISAPEAGDYTITVTPFNIVQDGQDFALVATFVGGSGSGAGDAGGGDGSAGAGGAGGSTDGGATGGTGGTDGGADDGCSCHVASPRPGSASYFALLGLTLLAPVRRRLRRRAAK